MRVVSMLLGFLLDGIIGDPQGAPHPVRIIGDLIGWCDRKFNRGTENQQRFGGIITLLIVWITTGIGVMCIYLLPLALVSLLHYQGILYNGMLWGIGTFVVSDAIVFYYSIAAKDLKKEALLVYKCLKKEDIEAARYNLSMIVGRDTDKLDKEGIIKAAVETVAENAGDGVIGPMLFYALFGGIGVWIFKATSTMDSMIGYKDEKYRYFGTAGARMDDVFNFIPARITAWLIIIFGPMVVNVTNIVEKYRGKDKISDKIKILDRVKVYYRFNKCSPSPNSAHPEAAMAGVLGIRLGGPCYYKGIFHKKPYIGNGANGIMKEHIKVSCNILTVIANVMLVICVVCLGYYIFL